MAQHGPKPGAQSCVAARTQEPSLLSTVLENQGTPSPRPPCFLCMLDITSWLASRLDEEDQTRTVQKLPRSSFPDPLKMFTCHGFLEVAGS